MKKFFKKLYEKIFNKKDKRGTASIETKILQILESHNLETNYKKGYNKRRLSEMFKY